MSIKEKFDIISLDRSSAAVKIQYYYRQFLKNQKNLLLNINENIFKYTGKKIDLSNYVSKQNIYKIFQHVKYYKNGYIILLFYIVFFIRLFF